MLETLILASDDHRKHVMKKKKKKTCYDLIQDKINLLIFKLIMYITYHFRGEREILEKYRSVCYQRNCIH